MIDRADDIMTTQGPHETRSERWCWIYLQNIMKSLQVSSFWILELWSTICFLRSRWLLTFGHQQSARPSGCIQMSSLHFTSLPVTSLHFTSVADVTDAFTGSPWVWSVQTPIPSGPKNLKRTHVSCIIIQPHQDTEISSSADCRSYLMISVIADVTWWQ